MGKHPFVASTFAGARKFLQRARVAQENALLFSMTRYAAGKRGADSRALEKHWHDSRALWLKAALQERARAKALRKRVLSELAKTDPPPSGVHERSA